ncbi:MAG: hypothetical protein ACP5OO_09835 [Chloroflexia bacterium]
MGKEMTQSWEDWVYNFARPHKSLRLVGQRRWQQRLPAMAVGLTHHIWTIEELLTHVPVYNND